MAKVVQFTVNTKTFSKALTGLLKLWSSKSQERTISIRAYGDNIELCIPGGMTKIKAEVSGEASIITPANLIIAYIKTTSSGSITFKFSPGQLECGSSIFTTTAIELSSINKEAENDEYININQLSLVRILLKNEDSLIDNRSLLGNLKKARTRFKNDLVTASEILETYGIRYEDLEQFVIKQIKGE